MERINRHAGFWPRLLAHNIDLVPILLLFYGVSFIIPQSDYDYLIISTIYFGYHIFFEASSMRATPGKKWVKIHVDPVKPRPSLLQSAIRNFAKVLSLLLFFGGFIIIFFNTERRSLHDYIGGTVVLFDED